MQDEKLEKTVGAVLKEARVVKNISLEEVSSYTKIHIGILKNIESDDFKALGNVYIKSFLRIYAEYLGLNKEDVIFKYQQAIGLSSVEPAKRVKIPALKQVVEESGIHLKFYPKVFDIFKKINFKFVIALVLTLVVFVNVIKINKTKKVPALKKVSSVKRVVLKTIPGKKSVVLLPSLVKVQKDATVFDKQVVFAKAVKEASALSGLHEKIVLVVKAKDKCWLQVKVDGKIIFSNTLAKGASESWQAVEKIELWIGNASNINLELNGKLLGKIGRPGQTIKQVVVTKNGLSISR